MRERVTLYVLGSAALIWPLAAHAQSTTQPTQGTAAKPPRIEMVRVKLIDQNAPEPRFQLRTVRRPVQTGFTRSSTMVTGSWPGETRSAFG